MKPCKSYKKNFYFIKTTILSVFLCKINFMKNKILLVCFFACSTLLFTQHVFISQDIVPNTGDVFTLHTVNFSNHGANGIGVNWDFSAGASTNTTTIEYINPISTPFSMEFPSSNICSGSAGGGYNYEVSNLNEWQYLGWASVVSGIHSEYSNPRKLFVFPFSYGDEMNDTYFGDYYTGTSYITHSGNVQLKYVGSGNIITPAGSYANVSKFMYVDSSVSTTVSSGVSSSYNQYQTTYYWYKPGTSHPLYIILEGEVVSSMVNYNYQYAYYLDATSVRVNYFNNTDPVIHIYPNPANKYIHIQSDLVFKKTRIFDITGKLVYSVDLSNTDTLTPIDISALTSGTYLLELTSNAQTFREKFIIQW